MIITFFRFSDRTPVSRVRDCCGLAGNSEKPGGCHDFADATILTISEHGTSSRYSMGEGPPIKAGHWGTIPHLETTCSRFNTSTRRRTSSSAGPGRSPQLEILPSLNSKEFFSGPPTFHWTQGFYHPPWIWPPPWFHLRHDFTIAMVYASATFLASTTFLACAMFLYIFLSALILIIFLHSY